MIPELAEFAETVIAKQHLDAFTETTLSATLQQLGATRLVLCGVCTDI